MSEQAAEYLGELEVLVAALTARAEKAEERERLLVNGSTDAWVVMTLQRAEAAEERVRELESELYRWQAGRI